MTPQTHSQFSGLRCGSLLTSVPNVAQFIQTAAGCELKLFLSLGKSSAVRHQSYSADMETADRVSHRGDVNSHDSYFTHRQSAAPRAFTFSRICLTLLRLSP